MTTPHSTIRPRTISLPGILMRPFTDDDAPALAVVLRDAAALRWAVGGGVANAPEPDRARLWLENRRDCWNQGIAYFAVADPADGTLLGSINLREINRLPQQAVAGYWTTPAARGRGIATRCLDAVAHWGLSPSDPDQHGLGLHRVSLDHALLNPASCKVACKADFQIEGTMRDFYVEPSGRRHDSHLHARLVTDAAAAPEGFSTAML